MVRHPFPRMEKVDMWRFLCALALGASACAVQPAFAQESSDRDDAKGQGSKIEKLRGEVRDALARLQEARKEASDDDEKSPTTRGRRGRENPGSSGTTEE